MMFRIQSYRPSGRIRIGVPSQALHGRLPSVSPSGTKGFPLRDPDLFPSQGIANRHREIATNLDPILITIGPRA
jgi:hypothetical protein